MVRTIFIAAALATAFGFTLHGRPSSAAEKPVVKTYMWYVSLNADGRVAALRGPAAVAESIRDPLEKAIRTWTFEPGRVNDRPAPTETTLSVSVSFVPTAGDRYSIRIDDARTGGSIDEKTSMKNPPRFPRDAMRLGLVARVVVKANYDANGQIYAVEPQPDQGINATRSLDAATVAAVRKWRIEPERVAGHAVASSVLVPICYTVSNGHPPAFDCDWTPTSARSPIGDGNAYALAPAASLKSDVIGHTL